MSHFTIENMDHQVIFVHNADLTSFAPLDVNPDPVESMSIKVGRISLRIFILYLLLKVLILILK